MSYSARYYKNKMRRAQDASYFKTCQINKLRQDIANRDKIIDVLMDRIAKLEKKTECRTCDNTGLVICYEGFNIKCGDCYGRGL